MMNWNNCDSKNSWMSLWIKFRRMFITFNDFIWMKFAIDSDWKFNILDNIISINFNSGKCLNYLFIVFFGMWITFINHDWIKITIETNWIICIFISILSSSIDYNCNECWIDWWFHIFRSGIMIDHDWRLKIEIQSLFLRMFITNWFVILKYYSEILK
jgi:hypothetical protein